MSSHSIIKLLLLMDECYFLRDSGNGIPYTLIQRVLFFKSVIDNTYIQKIDQMTSTTWNIAIKEGLREAYNDLQSGDHQTISTWANTYIDLIQTREKNRALAAEHERYLEWIAIRNPTGAGPFVKTISSQTMTLTDNPIRDALVLTPNPFSKARRLILSSNIDWTSNSHCPVKAYIMSCLSEISYLQLTDHELNSRDRYKLFEFSLLADTMSIFESTVELRQVLIALEEFGIQVIQTNSYMYVVFDLWGAVVVAVRGTRFHSITDWLINFRALKTKTDFGSFHRGYYDEAMTALPLLQKAIGTRSPIYFTGHSLGGATATVLSQIWPDQNKVGTPYVFASPRFGARDVSIKQKRYFYLRPFDIVPHLPPKIFGYSDTITNRFIIPEYEYKRSFVTSLSYWFRNLTCKQHSIEEHRRIIGESIGEYFPNTVYRDAIMMRLLSKAT